MNKTKRVYFKTQENSDIKYFVKSEPIGFPAISVDALPILNTHTSILKDKNKEISCSEVRKFLSTPEKLWKQLTLEELESLLVQKLNPDLVIINGNTLAHLYASAGKFRYLKVLLKYGANVGIKNHADQTPMDCCLLKFKKLKHLESLTYRECMKILFSAGSGPSANANKKFPHIYALVNRVLSDSTYIRSGEFRKNLLRSVNILTPEQLKILLYFNLDANFKYNGDTLLELYGERGNYKLVQELLEFDPTLKITHALCAAESALGKIINKSQRKKLLFCIAFLESLM